MSKADFAFSFADALGMSNLCLKRVDMGCIQSLVAKRPFDMRMNVSLFETKMCLELPILKDEIRRVADSYMHSNLL